MFITNENITRATDDITTLLGKPDYMCRSILNRKEID